MELHLLTLQKKFLNVRYNAVTEELEINTVDDDIAKEETTEKKKADVRYTMTPAEWFSIPIFNIIVIMLTLIIWLVSGMSDKYILKQKGVKTGFCPTCYHYFERDWYQTEVHCKKCGYIMTFEKSYD